MESFIATLARQQRPQSMSEEEAEEDGGGGMFSELRAELKSRVIAYLDTFVPPSRSPYPETCSICFEACIYSVPEVTSSKYTHMVCCSKRICDECAGKMHRTACPFCNQSMMDVILSSPTSLRERLASGVCRGDPDSIYGLHTLTRESDKDLSDRLVHAAAKMHYQPAMLRVALDELGKVIEELTPEQLLRCLLRDESPTRSKFVSRVLPLMKKVYPCPTISNAVDKMAEKEDWARQMAIDHGIGVKCDYCGNASAVHRCACCKTVYCNQTCQAISRSLSVRVVPK